MTGKCADHRPAEPAPRAGSALGSVASAEQEDEQQDRDRHAKQPEDDVADLARAQVLLDSVERLHGSPFTKGFRLKPNYRSRYWCKPCAIALAGERSPHMSGRLDNDVRPFDPDLPLEEARTIPSRWYTDPDIYAAECEKVFGGCWQPIGRTDQVAEAGSYFTMDVAGEPILVVRDAEGTLRAFYNVCRHRAARVAPLAEGKVSRL